MNLEVFNHQKWGRKIIFKKCFFFCPPDFYIRFKVLSQKYRRLDKDLYFIYLIYSHIWINISMDDSHFFNFFQLDLGKVAIIQRNIYPNMAINHIYEIQIFDHPSIFLATLWIPSLWIWWSYLLLFSSLVATENLQNHFFFRILIFKFLFLAKFSPVKKSLR